MSLFEKTDIFYNDMIIYVYGPIYYVIVNGQILALEAAKNKIYSTANDSMYSVHYIFSVKDNIIACNP